MTVKRQAQPMERCNAVMHFRLWDDNEQAVTAVVMMQCMARVGKSGTHPGDHSGWMRMGGTGQRVVNVSLSWTKGE